MNCPPGCPHQKQQSIYPDPRCMCNKPLGIYIPPGEHIHPCPVHPEVVIYGPMITCGTGTADSGGFTRY